MPCSSRYAAANPTAGPVRPWETRRRWVAMKSRGSSESSCCVSAAHNPVDRRGRHGEEQGAADEFEESVEPFQDDADFEGPVEKVLGPEPAHSGPPSRFSQIGSDKAW